MKPMQSFLIFFYILDQGYSSCNNDDLGGFLGIISPEIWGNGLPIDIAVFHDWERFSNPETVDINNIREKVYTFIEYYERQWGYNFSETKQWILTAVDEAIVEKAYAKTQLMYEKYQYAN